MTVPNRAENFNRKIGDHTTPLIHLHPDMRPSGTSISIQEKDPRTGGYGRVKPTGIYETGSHQTVHDLLNSMKEMHPEGTMIHAEVQYHRDDIQAQREKEAAKISKNPEGSFAQMTSGATRQLAINAEATRRVPTKAAASFKA